MDDGTMGDFHSFDDLEIEPIEPLESQNPFESEFASDVEFQIDPIVSFHGEEEPETPMSYQPLQEESEKPILSFQPTSDADSQAIENIDVTEAFTTDSQAIENIDVTEAFTTDMVFHSRDELVRWTRDVGNTVGSVVVISKSDMGGPGRIPRICFACERSGKRRDERKWFNKTNKTRMKRTKRCGCPFALKGIKLPHDDQWKVQVVSGYHNHLISQPSGRLTLEEKEIVEELMRSGVKPKDVLNVLKEKNGRKTVKLRTIYNARMQMKNNEMSTKSQMQQLLKKLAEHKYMEWHRNHEDGESVRDLFWAHPESVKLAKCFPGVFLMDCTNKRNNYRPSLLEIVGVTSTNKTFSFAFVYVEAEKEDNFVWALDCMKSILSSGPLPSVIVTHKEVPLMKAIRRVFPEAQNFLCRHHISTDLVTNCKPVLNTNEAWNAFMSAWDHLVLSSTEEEYCERLSAFEACFSEYPGVLLYVHGTWLETYKECFISAWTDQHIHFGNTTTNRTDNDQARLKRHLGSSQGNFNTMWTAISSLLLLQHAEIHASFKESLTTAAHICTSPLFDELKGFVSVVALDLILMEVKCADSIGPDDSACHCAIQRTHGLPCVHEICKYKNDGHSIPISFVHPHWKKLSSAPIRSPQHELYYRPEIQLFINRFEMANENLKLELLEKLREIITSI